MLLRGFAKRVRLPVANPRQSVFVVLPKRTVRDPVHFLKLAEAQVDRVGAALATLQTSNPESEFSAAQGKVALRFGQDVFELATDLQLQVLILQVPRLGVFRYVYDEDNDRWVGENDGHNLEELLTRELMRVSQGYLQL